MFYNIISLLISFCLIIASYPVTAGSNKYLASSLHNEEPNPLCHEYSYSSVCLAPPSVAEINPDNLSDPGEGNEISRREALKRIGIYLPAAALLAALTFEFKKNVYPTIIGATEIQRKIINTILRELPPYLYAGLNTIKFVSALKGGAVYNRFTNTIQIDSEISTYFHLKYKLLHELGHHYYYTHVPRKIRRKLSSKHTARQETFDLISSYAKDESPWRKILIPSGVEAFAEIYRCWGGSPGILFLFLDVAKSDVLRFFIEQVSQAFTYQKADGWYVRYFFPSEMDRKFIDIKVPGKSISFEMHRQNYLSLLPRVSGGVVVPEYHVKTFNLLSFLYGKEYIEGKDNFVIGGARLQVHPSKIHPQARAALSQLYNEWYKRNTSLEDQLSTIGSKISTLFKYELLRKDIRQQYQQFHKQLYLAEYWFSKDLTHALQTWDMEDHGTPNFKKRIKFMRNLIKQAGIDQYDVTASPVVPIKNNTIEFLQSL